MKGQYIHFFILLCFVLFFFSSLLVCFLILFFSSFFLFSFSLTSPTRHVLQQTPRLILMQTKHIRPVWGWSYTYYISNLRERQSRLCNTLQTRQNIQKCFVFSGKKQKCRHPKQAQGGKKKVRNDQRKYRITLQLSRKLFFGSTNCYAIKWRRRRVVVSRPIVHERPERESGAQSRWQKPPFKKQTLGQF